MTEKKRVFWKRFLMKGKRLLSALLAAVMILAAFPETLEAATCTHPNEPTKFDYRRNSSKEGDINTYAYCPDCGEWYLYCVPSDPAIGHRWVQTDFAYTTCTTDGYYTIECQRCHAKETTVTDKAYGHRWGDWKIEKDPTCTEDGVRKRTCEECYEVETSHTPATGHSWGEWTVTKPAGHGVNGEETRECSVCHEKETRPVEGEAAVARPGDSSIEVFVTQQLLADGGEFAGTVDGVFGEDLAAAIRAFEKASGLAETGEIYNDTLQLLSIRYLDSFEGEFTPDGLLEYFDSGLMTLLYISDHCMSNGNGTHDNAPYAIGVRYLLNSEELDVYIMPENFIYFDPYTEGCSIGNGTHTCPKCGYHAEEWTTDLAAVSWLAEHGGSFITLNLDVDLGLPEIENLFYDEVPACLTWDVFPGAKFYEVDMKLNGETPVVVDTEDTFLAMGGFAAGNYAGTLQAYDDAGEPVSNPTSFAFCYLKGEMPLPKNVRFENGAASWDYPNESLNAQFRVVLFALIPGADGKDEKKELYTDLTEDRYRDYSELYVKYTAVLEAARLEVQVQAIDADGYFTESKPVLSEPVPYKMPEFYKATAAVNVRSGPGRFYERIGGLSRGDFVTCWGQAFSDDGVYYIVNYKGQAGYVLTSCLAWIAPKDFTVTVDLQDGRTVPVQVNLDGTLNEVDFAQKVKKYGHTVAEVFNVTWNTAFRWDDVLEPDIKLKVSWQRDPAFVFVTFHDPEGKKYSFKDPDTGKSVNELPVRIGRTCPDKGLFGIDYSKADSYWTTEPDGGGTVVNAQTRFTADMTDLYENWLYAGEETEMKVGETTLYVTDIYKCLFSDTKLDENSTEVLGMLEPGDRIRIMGRAGDAQIGRTDFTWKGQTYYVLPEFYKIWCYKLDRECYVLRLAFDVYEAKSYTVHFDPDGGWCPVKTMTANVCKGYGYSTILDMPTPVRDGWMFNGWKDEEGERYKAGSEFRKETYLKADWIVGVEYPTKLGVTAPSTFSADREKITCRKTPEAQERTPIPAGKEVTVVGENRLMYKCLYDGEIVWIYKDNVCLNFNRTVTYSAIRPLFVTPGGRHMGDFWDGAVYYIIGEPRKGQYPVVFDVDDAEHLRYAEDGDSAKMNSGFGWTPISNGYQAVNRIVFDPLRGYCDTKETVLEAWVPDGSYRNSKLESLPSAYCPGHRFEGWYTDPIGGELVTVFTEITHSMTLYAHYADVYEAICVATERAPIYNRCSTSKGTILGYVEIGEVIAVDDESKTGLFYYTNHKGVSGWVQSRYLVVAEKKIARADPKTDRGIRSGPKKSAKRYRDIRSGEVFFIVDGENSWNKVAFPECGEGFAYVAGPQLISPEDY